MNIKRFVAKNMQEGLKQVRDELGAEAVILSNERCTSGIEIVAALDYDEQSAAASLSDDEHISVEAGNPSGVARMHARKHVQLQTELSRVKQHIHDVNDTANQQQKTRQAAGRIDLSEKERELRHRKRLRELHGEPRNPVLEAAAQTQPALRKAPSKKKKEASSRIPERTQRPAPRQTDDTQFRGDHIPGFSSEERTREDLRRVQAELAELKEMIRSTNVVSRPIEPVANRDVRPKDRVSMAAHSLRGTGKQRYNDDVDLHQDSSWIEVSLKSHNDETMADAPSSSSQRPSSADAQLNSSKTRLFEQFTAMGLDSPLVNELVNESDLHPEYETTWKGARKALESRIQTIPGEIIDRGGVIALVGPTGSGKTTTIGKLAARYVMKFGASSIALVTTDNYRVAAHEQLKTFGRILGVPVYTVDEQNSLDKTLDKLSDKRCVLIDTAGLLPTDPNWNEQLSSLHGSNHRVKSYMVVSAVGQYQLMQANHQQYQADHLSGAIITKLDEALSLGELIRFLVASQLKVAYLADGQKVPDDIHPMNVHKLVDKAHALLNNEERWVTISSESIGESSSRFVNVNSAS